MTVDLELACFEEDSADVVDLEGSLLTDFSVGWVSFISSGTCLFVFDEFLAFLELLWVFLVLGFLALALLEVAFTSSVDASFPVVVRVLEETSSIFSALKANWCSSFALSTDFVDHKQRSGGSSSIGRNLLHIFRFEV
jgi:hypothetical protein